MAYVSTHTGAQIDNFDSRISALETATTNTALINLIYPIGSIYMSVNSTSPATLFGGTWVQIQDTFLLACGSTYSNGATGGAASINLSHTHTMEHTHTTGDFTLTTAHIPAHTHGSKSLTGYIHRVVLDDGESISQSGIVSYSNSRARSWTGTNGTACYRVTVNATHEHSSVGSGEAHNHGSTGAASNSTTNSKLSSSQSIMPPYLAVYVQKRTA